MKARITAWTIVVMTLGIAGLAHSQASLDVSTQILKVDSIIITNVESPSNGWVTVHVNEEGSPGALLGHVAVNQGSNSFLYVELDMTLIQPRLIAVLRADHGEAGVLELPGPDVAVRQNGQLIAQSFVLHGCRGGILCDL